MEGSSTINEYIRRGDKSKAPFRIAAAYYRQLGWTGTIPVTRHGTKAPLAKGITGHTGKDASDEELLKLIAEFPTANIGIRLPWNIVGIDVDAYDDKVGAETLYGIAEKLNCLLPLTWRSTSRAPDDMVSGIYLYQAPRLATQAWRNVLGPGIEIAQFHHRFATVAPSIHNKLGRPYKWWYGDAEVQPPRPGDLPWLPDVWNKYLLSPVVYEATDGATTAEAAKWFELVSDGDMCPFTEEAVAFEIDKIREAASGGGLHDAIVASTTYLCTSAAEGHTGLRVALNTIEIEVRRSGRDRNLRNEWDRAVKTAMAKAAALPQEEIDVCGIAADWRKTS